jgi:hypothetical protein
MHLRKNTLSDTTIVQELTFEVAPHEYAGNLRFKKPLLCPAKLQGQDRLRVSTSLRLRVRSGFLRNQSRLA